MGGPNNSYTSGRFNNVVTPGLVEPIEDRNTIDLLKSGEAQLREVMKSSYEPNKLGSQIEFNAVCLLQLGTELVGGKSLVRVKARIPEIHSILPIPSSPSDYNTIALYPTFQAATSDFGLASDAITEGGIIPGSKLVVSFDQMGNFSGGSLRKVFSWKEIPPPTTPPPATQRRQTARQRPQTSQSKKKKSPSTPTTAGPKTKVSYGKKPPAGSARVATPSVPVPSTIIDHRKETAQWMETKGKKPWWNPKRRRDWSKITGITLHQTAGGHNPGFSAMRNIAIPFVATGNGKAVYLWDMDWMIWHAQKLSNHDIGIEVAGRFAKVPSAGGGLGTYFGQTENVLTDAQINAVKAIIKYIVAEVAAHNGKIRYIHGHGQAYYDKPNGPGWQIWKKIALWAQSTFGLTSGPPGWYIANSKTKTGYGINRYGKFSRLDGWPIPKEWDSRSKFPAPQGGKDHDRDDPEQKLYHKAKKAAKEGTENEELKKVKKARQKVVSQYQWGHHRS